MAGLIRLRSEATIRLLIERLNWPVRMVRLQVAKEYAGLLCSPKYGHIAAQIFLNWIRERELESEVISALAVLACTPEQHLIPFQQLNGNIRRPSILANVLVQNIYQRSLDGWLDAHSGSAPPSFAGDRYFEKYKHSHVPPILDHLFEQLESENGFPLRRQWAFEWRRIVDSTGTPLSSYPYFFTDWATYRDSGVKGQFSQRQCDAYRSAFLRTLAFAVSTWKMPHRLAADLALFSLPVNREFVKLRPGTRPKWLSDIPERCCEQDALMENLVRDLLGRSNPRFGMRPVCIKIPVSSSQYLFGDLWIAAVLANPDYESNEGDGSLLSRGFDWTLRDGISLCGLLPERDFSEFVSPGKHGTAIPCCLDVWPMHLGFWHGDYYQLGVTVPATYLFPGDLRIACTDRRIEIFHDQTLSATVSIWHDDWSPLYPSNGTTRCGLVTDMRKADIACAEQELGLRLGWYGRLRLWRRDKNYAPFTLTERHTYFRDSDR